MQNLGSRSVGQDKSQKGARGKVAKGRGIERGTQGQSRGLWEKVNGDSDQKG